MSMKKRRNDLAHLSKDDYHAIEERDADGADQGMSREEQRASEEVLSKRRILKVSSKWKAGMSVRTPSAAMPAASTPALTPTHSSMNGGTDSKSLSARNPFSSTAAMAPSFSGSFQTNESGNDESFKNPFASVSFATTPVNKSTAFGTSTLIATSTKKQKPIAPGTYSDTALSKPMSQNSVSPVISTSPVPPSKPLPPLRPGAMQTETINMEPGIKMSLECLCKIEKEGIVNPLSDYSSFLKEYIQNKLQSHSTVNRSISHSASKGNATTSVLVPASKTLSTEDKLGPSSTASKPLFSFSSPPTESSGTKALEDKVEPSSTASKPLFSFSSSATESSGTKPFSGFSFGNTGVSSAVSTATPVPETEDAVTNNDGDDDDDDDGPVVIAGNTNEDEIDLYSCRAKYLRMVPKDTDATQKEWKTCSTGVLRVYKNKTDNKGRVVLRDAVGKVRLNIPVAKGTKFAKSTTKGDVGRVQFFSVMDEATGPEQFMLKTKLDYFYKLCETLETVAG